MVEEFLNNFHFLRPWFLLLLLLPIFFLRYFFNSMHSTSSWENVCDKKLLNFLLIRGSSSNRKLFSWLFILALTFAVLAAAGPTWQKKAIPTLIPENPVMILLNLSSDMKPNDIQPSRLDRAKFKIIDLLNGIPSAQEGLIVYAKEPFMITPISDDKDIIVNLLPAINYDIMPANGDRLDRAIALAVEKLKNGGYKEGNIIIFSADIGERFDKALEEAKTASTQNYKVSVIQTSSQISEKLKLVARYGEGYFHLISNIDQDIVGLEKFINQNISELKQSENSQSLWLDMGYYLCFIPLFCCLFFFRRGIFVWLPILFISTSAQAGWFLNNNQEGFNAFNQQDFQTAEQKFEDASWKAAAQYRLGNYDEAAKNFASSQDITSLYNLGNALAKGGKIDDAIKKYEEVLKLDPNHEDAKFNLEYLKKQQNQQQNQQNQQNQNQQQQQEQNQQQNQQQGNPSQDDDNQSENNAGDNQNQQDQQGQNNQNSQPQPNKDGEDDKSSAQNNPNEENSSSSAQEKQQDMSAQDEASSQKQDEQEDKQSGGSVSKQGDKQDKYDEMRQAKVQQLRQIPEEPGGLLKAFIAKEYRLNRYGDD